MPVRRSQQCRKPGQEDTSARGAARDGTVVDPGETALVVPLGDQGRAEQNFAGRHMKDVAVLRAESDRSFCQLACASGLTAQQANRGTEEERDPEIARIRRALRSLKEGLHPRERGSCCSN